MKMLKYKYPDNENISKKLSDILTQIIKEIKQQNVDITSKSIMI